MRVKAASFSRSHMVVTGLAVGIVGSMFLYASFALTPTAASEAEDGVMSGGVSQVSDASASGGNAIRFSATQTAVSYYVSPSGSDSAAGTIGAPWQTFSYAITRLNPGDTLYARDGTYNEQVMHPTINAGNAPNPIVVRAYPGERPIISGLFYLDNASYWTIDGINVTWNVSNPDSHMVRMSGGTHWRITNAEIWGAHTYAAILVSESAGIPDNYSIDHNYIHDTYETHGVGTNQDHLIYVNAGNGGGTIERNILAHSSNGRGIKIGPPSSSTDYIGNVTIRYNTFYDNLGPSNLQMSYGASGNQIYRNIMVLPGSGKTNITQLSPNGTGNTAYDNIGWQSTGFMSANATFTDGGGNQLIDPQFVNTATDDFHTQNPAVASYGRYAP